MASRIPFWGVGWPLNATEERSDRIGCGRKRAREVQSSEATAVGQGRDGGRGEKPRLPMMALSGRLHLTLNHPRDRDELYGVAHTARLRGYLEPHSQVPWSLGALRRASFFFSISSIHYCLDSVCTTREPLPHVGLDGTIRMLLYTSNS